MEASKNCFDLIKEFEGLRLKAYKCQAGKWTIGYGHTDGVKKGDSITKEEADFLLECDIRKFERCVDFSINVPLDQNEFDALVSFCFNIGRGAFKKSTLRKHLNNLFYDLAAEEFAKWNKVKGSPNKGLTNRRKKEKALFLGVS
jgi:lysozyme